MSTQLEAVFENGVFRPLQPIQLPEHQRVTVTIERHSNAADSGDRSDFILSEERWQTFCDALDAPPKVIPALRKLLNEPSLFDGNHIAQS